jgi:hypothetical protein
MEDAIKKFQYQETSNVVIIFVVVFMKHMIFSTQPHNEERKRFI